MQSEEDTPLLTSSESNSTEVIDEDICDSRHQHNQTHHVKRFITVEPLVLFVMMFLSSNFVTTQYVYRRIAQDYNYTGHSMQGKSHCQLNSTQDDSKTQEKVQELSTMYNMLNSAALVLPVIFASIFVGPYTDKAGRKYGMVPQLCSSAIRMGLSVTIVATDLPLFCFCMANIIGSLTGGEYCISMTCFAYIADITTKEQRSTRIYVVQTLIMVGSTAAILITSYMILYIGFLYTYVCFLCLYVPALIYTIFVLPETIIQKSQATLLTLTHFKGALKLYTTKTLPPRSLKLVLYVAITIIGYVCLVGTTETITLYLFNTPFCWNTVFVGYFSGLTMVTMGLGGAIIIPLTSKCLSDEGRIVIGCLSGMLYFIGLAFAFNTFTAFMVPILGVALGLVSPMGRAAATKVIEPNEQGQLQATITPLEQIGIFVANLVNNSLYVASLLVLRGLQYIFSAFVMVIVMLLAGILLAVKWRERKQLQKVSNNLDT